MRAYKFADADNSGLITKSEFVTLLRALTFFQNLWKVALLMLAHACLRVIFFFRSVTFLIWLSPRQCPEIAPKIAVDFSGIRWGIIKKLARQLD